jgi:hypothetical protein
MTVVLIGMSGVQQDMGAGGASEHVIGDKTEASL